jgi:hypothetical protein
MNAFGGGHRRDGVRSGGAVPSSVESLVNILSAPDVARSAGLIRRRVIDAELAALVEILAAHRLPLVVAAPDTAGRAAADMLAALDAGRVPVDLDALGDGALALLRAASLGAGFAATIRAGSLEEVRGRLQAAAGAGEDELSYLGVVVILDEAGRVVAAHHVRPLALDGQGHVQRLGPAVLAARDARSDELEHFAWGVMPELAARVSMKAGDLEAEIARRRDTLTHAVGHVS